MSAYVSRYSPLTHRLKNSKRKDTRPLSSATMRTTALLFAAATALAGQSATAFQPVPSASTSGAIRTSPKAITASSPHRPAAFASQLASATSSDGDAGSDGGLDVGALGKYALAAGIQMSLFSGVFKLADIGLASAGLEPSSLPFAAIAFVFYACALKSRVFNPLNNARPDRSKAVEGKGSDGFRDRVMPSWTPPGVIFPIMWLLIIGPIRAYSSAMIVSSTGTFFNPAIMAFIFHLTCGDVWNTINNTEKRYGMSVVGILLGVVPSAAFAASQYYAIEPLAGKLLGGTLLWLCTASALITDTWRLNPDENGKREALYPVKGDAKTEFAWF